MTQATECVEQSTEVCTHHCIELASVVDWGEPFVKACYFLEGDGSLAVNCYKAVERIQARLRTEDIPNVTAIAQKLSGKAQGEPSHEGMGRTW